MSANSWTVSHQRRKSSELFPSVLQPPVRARSLARSHDHHGCDGEDAPPPTKTCARTLPVATPVEAAARGTCVIFFDSVSCQWEDNPRLCEGRKARPSALS